MAIQAVSICLEPRQTNLWLLPENKWQKAIKAKSSEIIFTSGGTESNNLAILGLARARRNKGNHVIVSQIEHPSVLEAAKVLEKEGFQVTYLPVTETGLVSLPDLMHEIKKETILISIMMANNEVGTVQNIRAISDIIRDESIILHTDAVQAFGAVSIDVKALEVDALTISGHKIYGPKGVGALYLKTGVAIAKQQVGGGQERGLRSGTLNVPGIVGFGKACEAAIRDLSANNQKLKQIRDYFIAHVKAKIPGAYLNGHPLQRLANNANFSFEAIEGEGLLTLLSINGIAVSTGSACNSEKLEKSHVLKAMNIPEDLVQSSIRFSFAKSITKEDIDYVEDFMIQLKKLNKTYINEGGLRYHAIKDVSLELPGTGMHFIAGPSGCGKSTLLNIISGLDMHDEGELLIKGVDTRDFNLTAWDSYRNTYCGFVFQEYNLLDYLTLAENVALGVENTGAKISKEEIGKVFAQLGIAGLEDRYPNNCSGGQRQRAAIARVLIKKPRILFADEPAGSVDSASRKVIYDILKELSKELLVIAVTHDPGIVDKYADRVVTMEDGRIVSDKPGLAATKAAAKAVAATKKSTKKAEEAIEATPAKTDNEPLRLVKAKLPARVVLRLSKTNFTASKIRTTFTILLTILALTFFAISGIVSNFNGTSATINAFHNQASGYIGLTSSSRTLSNQDIYDFFGGTSGDVPGSLAGQYAEMRLVGNKSEKGAIAKSRSGDGVVPGSYVDLNIFAHHNPAAGAETEPNNFGQVLSNGRWGTTPTEIAISDYTAYQMMQRGIFPAGNNVLSFDDIVDANNDRGGAQRIWLELNDNEKVELSVVGIYKTNLNQFFEINSFVLSEKQEIVDTTASQNQLNYYYENVYPVFYGMESVLNTITNGSIFLYGGRNTAAGVTVSATVGTSQANILSNVGVSRDFEFKLRDVTREDIVKGDIMSISLDYATANSISEGDKINITIKRDGVEKTLAFFATIRDGADALANDVIELSTEKLAELKGLAVAPVLSIALSQEFSAKQLNAMAKDISDVTFVSAETENVASVADRLRLDTCSYHNHWHNRHNRHCYNDIKLCDTKQCRIWADGI
ncbi:cysteine desulfurylase family member [Holotrichia oblita]|nr:cysteine desulfurylase family member [Holotrichia oblita]